MWFKVLESNMLTRGMEAVLVSNSPILANQGPKGVQSTYLQGKSGLHSIQGPEYDGHQKLWSKGHR